MEKMLLWNGWRSCSPNEMFSFLLYFLVILMFNDSSLVCSFSFDKASRQHNNHVIEFPQCMSYKRYSPSHLKLRRSESEIVTRQVSQQNNHVTEFKTMVGHVILTFNTSFPVCSFSCDKASHQHNNHVIEFPQCMSYKRYSPSHLKLW